MLWLIPSRDGTVPTEALVKAMATRHPLSKARSKSCPEVSSTLGLPKHLAHFESLGHT